MLSILYKWFSLLDCLRVSKFLIVLAVSLMIFNCTTQTYKYSKYLVNLKSNSIEVRFNTIIEIHKNNKKAIPKLIELINDSVRFHFELKSPLNSTIGNDLSPKFSGILLAYMIELILAREELIFEPNENVQWILGSNPNNYIYFKGVIQFKNSSVSLTLSDMRKIKNIYLNWWKQHKNKDIDDSVYLFQNIS